MTCLSGRSNKKFFNIVYSVYSIQCIEYRSVSNNHNSNRSLSDEEQLSLRTLKVETCYKLDYSYVVGKDRMREKIYKPPGRPSGISSVPPAPKVSAGWRPSAKSMYAQGMFTLRYAHSGCC